MLVLDLPILSHKYSLLLLPIEYSPEHKILKASSAETITSNHQKTSVNGVWIWISE